MTAVKIAGIHRILSVRKDPRDICDRMYEPALIPLPPKPDNRSESSVILDQGGEGACTGFGL